MVRARTSLPRSNRIVAHNRDGGNTVPLFVKGDRMLRFSTDHYFHIGSAHYRNGKPCQDYALSGVYGPVACAVVSDGCSTGRHTDVGARVLTLSTLQAIRDHTKASGGALDTAVVSITSRQQQILSTTRII